MFFNKPKLGWVLYIFLWLKKKQTKKQKTKINPKNNDNKRLQYTVPVALSHENIVKDPEAISNPFNSTEHKRLRKVWIK